MLEDDELERALHYTQGHGIVVLDPVVEFTAPQVRALKEFYGDYFGEPPGSNEAKVLGQETSTMLQNLIRQVLLRLMLGMA